MKRIVVYRYYHKFEQNLELLKFFKYLNPDVNVYGIYGGDEAKFDEASEVLKEVFSGNYCIRNKENEWKWLNGDKTYQMWFNDFGHTVDYDIMHSIEWDLLYFDSLDNLFAHVPKDALALTGLIPLKKIKKTWYWTKDEQRKAEWLDMNHELEVKYGFDSSKPYGMLGPGTSLPRIYLEKIKDVEIPKMSLDELRIPALAQTFGIDMYDTFFYRKWFSEKEKKYFNSNAVDVEMGTIVKQLKKKKGRRVFHPFRMDITFEELKELHATIKS